MTLTSSSGIGFPLRESLYLTLDCIALKLTITWPSTGIIVKYKEGGDGSGSHARYHQLQNIQTCNMFLYMFCILRVNDKVTGTPFYVNTKPNSPHTHRPLFITMCKEDRELIGKDVTRVGREREALLDGALMGNTMAFFEPHFTLCDSKIRKTVLGIGGGFCLLCHVDKDSACGCGSQDPEDFFRITRSGSEIKEKYDQLEKNTDGRVITAPYDYAERGGVTQAPLVKDDAALDSLIFVSPLHALMRTFGWILRLLYHLISETHHWTESQKILGQSYQLYTNAKQEAKTSVFQATGIVMDSPDFAGRGVSTDKGDVCKRLLRHHRDVLVHLVPDHHQEKFQELLENLWIVLKIYCTKKIEDKKVDTPKLRVFCLDLYHLIFNNFGNEVTRWIKISPTVHSILAHSWELIKRNATTVLVSFLRAAWRQITSL